MVLSFSFEEAMKVGDLVMNIFTQELGLVTSFAIDSNEYVEVIVKLQEWLVPIEHLEVIQCNQVI